MKKSLFVLLVLAFVLTACGGGGPSTTIDVTFSEFTFMPTEFTIPAGQEIMITGKNEGAVEHEFVIFKLGTDAGDSFGPEDEENIFWELQVLPGESKTGTFTAPSDPGEYYVTCGLEGHLVAGMVGKLTVVTP
jgi:uncharacterized cupredoxin-like copper-binding protein